MKFTHELKVSVEGKSYDLVVRDLTKKEAKALQEKHDKLKNVMEEIRTIQNRAKRIERRLETAVEIAKEQSGEAKIKTLREQEKLHTEIETLEDTLQKMNFNDFDADLEAIFKERLSLCLSGTGVEDIMDLAESYGYKRIWEYIDGAVSETEKKQ